MALGDRAVVPLADSITIEHCRERPGLSYARIRLFGSLGFVVLTVLVGRLLTVRGGRPADPLVPALVVLCVAGYALAARGFAPSPRHGDRPAPRDMLALLRDGRLWALLGPAALHWAACAPYHVFFGVLVRDLGLPDDVTSAGMAIGVVGEIVALLAFPRLERRVPLRALFAVAFVGSALRWALLSRATHPATVAGLQALHGLTFGLFWGSAMRALADVVPTRLRATGQAVFTGVVFGGANAVGYALAGVGYDRFGGAAPLFAWAGAVELVSLAVLLAARGRGGPPRREDRGRTP
jgi:PPP family 3-phenylpropionic acid transporter